MVLTKLFNILAITTSVGGSVLTTPPQRSNMPNRDTTNRTPFSYTINWNTYQNYFGTDTWYSYVYNYINQYEYDVYNETRYYNEISINTNYVRGNGIRLNAINTTTHHEENQITGNITNTPYSVVGVRNSSLDPITDASTFLPTQETGYAEPIAVSQRMYIFALEGIGNNVETTITLKDLLYDIGLYDNDYLVHNPSQFAGANIGCYYRMLSSTNTAMENVMSYANKDDYWVNHSLYAGQTKIIMNNAGYNSTSTEGIMQTIASGNSAEQSSQLEIAIQKDKINYYVIYVEPRIIVQNLPIMQWTRSQNYVYNTSYEGQVVLTGENVVVDATIEVIDVPGIMFDVLGMPFTFISTAFNLTLFPGTPYELNISLLFLSIVAVIIFVFLIKFIIGKVK